MTGRALRLSGDDRVALSMLCGALLGNVTDDLRRAARRLLNHLRRLRRFA